MIKIDKTGRNACISKEISSEKYGENLSINEPETINEIDVTIKFL